MFFAEAFPRTRVEWSDGLVGERALELIDGAAVGGTVASHAADSRRSKRYFNALPSSFALIDGKMV